MGNILVITSGSKTKIRPFRQYAVTCSFDDIVYRSTDKKIYLKSGEDLASFDAIYFRLVGKSLETASLVADYAKKNRIKIVDRIYTKSQVFPISQSKAQEMKNLSDTGVSIPKTFFGSLAQIQKSGPKLLGFPFVIKSTSGRKGREVYRAIDRKSLRSLIKELKEQEKAGKKYFAQEFVGSDRRIRVMVVGKKALGAITQRAKWGQDKTAKKIDRFDLDKEAEKLAISATAAVGLDISGVDILKDEKSGKFYVIEVNAAPSWKLVKKYCRVNIENEIIKFIQGQI